MTVEITEGATWQPSQNVGPRAIDPILWYACFSICMTNLEAAFNLHFLTIILELDSVDFFRVLLGLSLLQWTRQPDTKPVAEFQVKTKFNKHV